MPSTGFTHESAYNESQEWYTPPRIFDALGLAFDMDVASPGARVVPWVPAARHLTFEDSGLLQKWEGRVWCNPPYGNDTHDWVQKFCHHGNGIMLVFARTDTAWFHKNARKVDLFCFVKGRIAFVSPTGKPSAGCGAASMLLACGKECADALQESGLGVCTSIPMTAQGHIMRQKLDGAA